VIDPLDGSSNFERGLPFFCTSIAIADGRRLRNVRYGIVKNLLSGETYYAEKGGSSRKDGTEIRSSLQRELRDSAFTVDMCRSPAPEIVRVAPLISSVRRQVHFGANALEVCLVAEGKLDGFVDIRGRMRTTDFAAGYLIMKEAGASVTDLDGSVLNPELNLSERFRVVAAGNRSLHRKVLGLIGVRIGSFSSGR
jgi:myo-inositol-1(or 4)-monophosphatase